MKMRRCLEFTSIMIKIRIVPFTLSGGSGQVAITIVTGRAFWICLIIHTTTCTAHSANVPVGLPGAVLEVDKHDSPGAGQSIVGDELGILEGSDVLGS